MSEIYKVSIFSLVTGDIFTVESDELKNLMDYQIPLAKLPSKSCKLCYGRFHVGFDPKKRLYELCPKCMNKCIDYSQVKQTHINVPTLKGIRS